MLMIGNKLDLAEQRQVSYEEAQRFAQENSLMYIETSSKNGNNVIAAFVNVTQAVYNNIKKGRLVRGKCMHV